MRKGVANGRLTHTLQARPLLVLEVKPRQAEQSGQGSMKGRTYQFLCKADGIRAKKKKAVPVSWIEGSSGPSTLDTSRRGNEAVIQQPTLAVNVHNDIVRGGLLLLPTGH